MFGHFRDAIDSSPFDVTGFPISGQWSITAWEYVLPKGIEYLL